MILSDWLRVTPAILERAGIEAPKSELYLWLTLVTGKNRAFFVMHESDPLESFLSHDNIRQLDDILLRRLEREPLAYILGLSFFWGRSFHVGPGVLIPRPDSEMVVETALAVLGFLPMPWGQCLHDKPESLTTGMQTDDIFRFMDLCTGSGCLGITLALELRAKKLPVSGILTDISSEAISYAQENILESEVSGNLTLSRCNLFPDFQTMTAAWGDKQADLILANPPYVTAKDMEGLMPEVFDYEPHLALLGGEDGLLFYRRILSKGSYFLKPGGWLVLEHGYDQGQSVPDICRDNGFIHVLCFRDYGGQPRVTIAQRSPTDALTGE